MVTLWPTLLPPAQAGLSNLVLSICRCRRCLSSKILKNDITRNLEAITTSKQEVTIQIPQKIVVCVPDSDQSTSSLCMSSAFLFNIDMVHYGHGLEYDRIRQRPGVCGLLTQDL